MSPAPRARRLAHCRFFTSNEDGIRTECHPKFSHHPVCAVDRELIGKAQHLTIGEVQLDRGIPRMRAQDQLQLIDALGLLVLG